MKVANIDVEFGFDFSDVRDSFQALNTLHPSEKRALIQRVKDRRRLALFIDDELADDTDHMMKKHP